MNKWILTLAILIGLGLLADYYFLHILFPQKQMMLIEEEANAENATTSVATTTENQTTQFEESQAAPTGDFLTALQNCRPDISAQGVTTPEAMMEYLEKSIGQESADVEAGNSFVPLKDDEKNPTQSVIRLKDKSVLTVDSRGGKVFAFQLKTENNTLSCRQLNCECK